MKKENKITNTKKVKKDKDQVDLDLEEPEDEEEPTTPELDPEILKALNKNTKKPKSHIDATDYIPELERDELEGVFDSRDY